MYVDHVKPSDGFNHEGCVYFFFFQAEDGIRDGRVTGVQTCALPIYPRMRLERENHGGGAHTWMEDADFLRAKSFGITGRSEERRVGKECRSRWSPYH